MERLTKRNSHDFAIPTQGTDAFHLFQCVDRLAAYEETGLEPEEIIQAMNVVKSAVSAFEDFGVDRLRELIQADREGRCVVLDDLTVADLQQMLTVLDSTRYGDGVETYTTGYRNGHRNGRIEILRHVLGINEGDSAEAALRGREQDD